MEKVLDVFDGDEGRDDRPGVAERGTVDGIVGRDRACEKGDEAPVLVSPVLSSKKAIRSPALLPGWRIEEPRAMSVPARLWVGVPLLVEASWVASVILLKRREAAGAVHSLRTSDTVESTVSRAASTSSNEFSSTKVSSDCDS